MIRIAADSQIPEIENKLSKCFDADYSLDLFETDKLEPANLRNIDALLVRSTLKVNEVLCMSSSLRYVGSATAGINHLDINFLDTNNIKWSNAPGCNVDSVVHYVLAALGELIQEGLFNVRQTIGIIGYGNIGKRLQKFLQALNIEVYACDPFISDSKLVNLDKILECDLLTIHAPYTTDGLYPTNNLINQSHLKRLVNKILINTSRGGIVSEDVVLQCKDLIYIADVWENEPAPSISIIEKAFIATPHIAGYSIEGKLNGSRIVAEECAKAFKCFKIDARKSTQRNLWPHGLENIVRDMHAFGFPISLFNCELKLKEISKTFKNLPIDEIASQFESLRATHIPRHDFTAFSYKNIEQLDEELNIKFFNF